MTPNDTPTLLTMRLEEWKRTDMPARRLWDEIAAQVALVQRLTRELDEHAAEIDRLHAVVLSLNRGALEQKATIARLTAELARAQDTVRRDTETMGELAAERDNQTARLKAQFDRGDQLQAETTRLTAVIEGHRTWLKRTLSSQPSFEFDDAIGQALTDLDQRLGKKEDK